MTRRPQIRCPRSTMAGFTLVELLVVTAILGLAMAAIGACLSGGIRVWDTARQFGRIESDVYLAMDRMSHDLRNSFPYYRIPFNGDGYEAAFPGLVAAEANAEPSLPGRITYWHEPATEQIMRSEFLADGDRVSDEILATGVKELKFRYAYMTDDPNPRLAEADSYQGTNAPRTVSIAITAVNPEAVSERDTWNFKRTILIPVQED